MLPTGSSKNYGIMHKKRKLGCKEPPCIIVVSIRIRWSRLKVEDIIVCVNWSVKFDVTVIGRVCQTSFQRF